ncbi:MAG: TIGR02206 family membrane protein [Acidobacteriota bacterium]
MEFTLFGKDHISAILVLALLAAGIVWAGKRAGRRARDWLGRALAFALIAYAAAMYLRLAFRGELAWAYSLPLELCHWVLIACLVSVLTGNRLASEIAYFWGLGGTLQAVLTPDLLDGFPSWYFIQFFWAHGVVILTVAYLIAARDFRPRPRSVVRMMLAANFYLLVAGSLDMIFGWNYGYLRRPPSQPSLLDYLGPWPWYILSLELIALATFLLLTLPFRRSSRQDHRIDGIQIM